MDQVPEWVGRSETNDSEAWSLYSRKSGAATIEMGRAEGRLGRGQRESVHLLGHGPWL